ncbi:hypothetical protein HX798_29080 [Pseudomonas putida]|uniref:Uncharacterized protein n=1 Tax=Pseudomonas putida TaxID=303 RepID=A0A7Y8D419_PSEPU|nr:hypothetical protein [Pseudomonas putida]NWC84302.1 hypothetical protein [Pseudomonas putida]
MLEDGTTELKGVGVAAHIYAASPNGPRPGLELSDKEKAAETNGVWLCPTHSVQVDQYQFEYPPERLLDMKRVRVFAHALTIESTDFGYLTVRVGPQRVDEIVRAHLPDLDLHKESIKSKVKALYLRIEIALSYSELGLPTAPFEVAHIPRLTQAVREIITEKLRYSDGNDQLWRNVIASWDAQFETHRDPQPPMTSVGHAATGVQFSARNPIDGSILKERLNTHSFILVTTGSGEEYDRREKTITVVSTASKAHPFNWEFKVRPSNRTFEVCVSKLTAHRNIMPKPEERKSFEAYAAIIDKLDAGWEPVAFLAMTLEDGEHSRDFHPTPISIHNSIDFDQLAELKARVTRLRLMNSIADQFQAAVQPSNVLFHQAVSDEILEQLLTGFLESLGPKPWPLEFDSEPLVVNEQLKIVLSLRRSRRSGGFIVGAR